MDRVVKYFLIGFSLLVLSCNEHKKKNNTNTSPSDSITNKESDKFYWEETKYSNKETVRRQYVKLNDTSFLNQEIYFDINGDTLKDKSSYFTIKLNDTLKLGKNIGKIYLNSKDIDIKDNIHKKYFMIVVENQYSDKKIQKDTFLEEPTHSWFGVFANEIGKKNIQGAIIEQLVTTNKINDDSLKAKIITQKKYFEKEVYVKDTVQ